jgi:hypothetical protein
MTNDPRRRALMRQGFLGCSARRISAVADEWYSANHVIHKRQPKPGELLFEFYVERTHTFYRAELRDHGSQYGWETQIFEAPDTLRIAHRFDHFHFPGADLRQLAIRCE